MSNASMLQIHARAKAGQPEGWTLFHYECLPKTAGPTELYILEGGIEATLKGKRVWVEPRKTVYITVEEHKAFCEKWESDSGLCAVCVGEGTIFAGWNITDGARTRPCKRCDATGKKPEEVMHGVKNT